MSNDKKRDDDLEDTADKWLFWAQIGWFFTFFMSLFE